MPAASVFIVDDHPGFRAWARAELEAHGFRIVGEAGDGIGAVESVARLGPEIVVLDVHLPDIDGFEVADRMSVTSEPPIVVLVSSRERDEFGSRIEESGVRGFLSKSSLTGRALDSLVCGSHR